MYTDDNGNPLTEAQYREAQARLMDACLQYHKGNLTQAKRLYTRAVNRNTSVKMNFILSMLMCGEYLVGCPVTVL